MKWIELQEQEILKLESLQDLKSNDTYYVPTTLFVFASFWFPPNILAMPKSEIFGFISSSNRMLLAFRSLWIILSLESLWRYSNPRAIPSIMLKRFLQSNWDFLAVSVKV